MAGNLTKQLNFGVDEDTFKTVGDISRKHKLPPVEFCRGVVESACAFYREHGWFSFPVRVEPEAFQREWMAAEPRQGGYEPSPTAQIEADEAARRDDAARAKAARKKRGAGPRSGATGRG